MNSKLPIRDSAFLIRSIRYQEDHRILSFLTQSHGRIDLIAYAAQKSQKRSGTLDFLNRINIEYQNTPGRSLSRLVHVELSKTFFALREDDTRCFLALEWLQLLAQLLPQGAYVAGLFELLEESLSHLEKKDPAWVNLGFRYHLLSCLGYQLDLESCKRCHQTLGPFQFAAEIGGLLCLSCQDQLHSHPLSQIIEQSFWNFEKEASPRVLLELKKILERSFTEFLGKPL